MKKFNVLGVVAFLIVALAIPGMAKEKGSKGSKGGGGEMISEVSESSITTSSGKTYTISADTTVTVDGSKAKAADLKKGMKVTVTPGADSPETAASISATNASSDGGESGGKKGGKKGGGGGE